MEAGNEVIAGRDHDIVGGDTSPSREDRGTNAKLAEASHSAWFLGRSPIQISSCIQHDMGISSRDEYELCQAPTGNVTSKLYQQGCA